MSRAFRFTTASFFASIFATLVIAMTVGAVELKPARNLHVEHWGQGEVKWGPRWVPYHDVTMLTIAQPNLDLYERVRQDYPKTAAGQLSLADWCAKRGLKDQERAHLTVVLNFEPDHEAVRARLGFLRVDGAWVTKQQLDATAEQARIEAQAMRRWGDKLRQLRNGIEGKSELVRNAALEKIRTIRGADAVLPLERLVSTSANESAALAVVAALSAIDSDEATISLARHAAFHASDDVRYAATTALKSRTFDVFVPKMLAAMFTPVEMQTDVAVGAGGTLTISQSFKREGQEQQQEAKVQTVVRPATDDRITLAMAQDEAKQRVEENLKKARDENERTELVNRRVSAVLASISGADLPAEPQLWWKWWNARNEVFVGPKPTKSVFSYDERIIVPPVPPLESFDCLAHGTPVWTSRGLIAIERIDVGDLVLSQHPETGELAYKPVLATTVRPASRLACLTTAEETLRTSGGHPLWVDGKGWVKARHIASNDALYSVAGLTTVTATEMNDPEQTYNLVVADFHTYFIGRSRVLSHDNTVCAPTRNNRPGAK